MGVVGVTRGLAELHVGQLSSAGVIEPTVRDRYMKAFPSVRDVTHITTGVGPTTYSLEVTSASNLVVL